MIVYFTRIIQLGFCIFYAIVTANVGTLWVFATYIRSLSLKILYIFHIKGFTFCFFTPIVFQAPQNYTSECVFLEEMMENYYNLYSSCAYGTRKRPWYVALVSICSLSYLKNLCSIKSISTQLHSSVEPAEVDGVKTHGGGGKQAIS